MSVTTAQELIDDVESILQDEGNDHWSAAFHLQMLNNGMKEICLVKPDAYVIDTAIQLVAGISQSLPASGFQLLDILCNMGTDGSTPGDAVKLIDREILDAMIPGWPAATTSATVQYYMYDETVPTKFLVYPPQPSSSFGYVRMRYGAAPAEIGLTDTILIPDIYRGVLQDYMLFRAYSMDSDVPASATRAVSYYQAYQAALGIRQNVEEREDINNAD